MAKYLFTIWLIMVPSWIIHAQEKFITVFDTVKLNEVSVSHSIPLNDESMVNRYQASYASSIDRINARLGGVSVISRGAYAMQPVLNAFSGGQINVTIDGMKMFGACTDKMDPVTSYVEPVNLKSIEVDHGSNGSKNGSTVGGTFDMSLQQPAISSVNTEAGFGYETVSGGKTGFLAFNYGRKKWAYRVSGVYKDYNSYVNGKGITVPYSQYGKFNLNQSLLFEPVKGHVLVLDWLIDNAANIGYPALPMDVGKAKGRIYSVAYQPNEKIMNIRNFKARIYYNSVFHLMDDSHRDSLFFVENTSTNVKDSVYMRMDMPGWSKTYGAYIEGVIDWLPDHWFSFKIEDYLHWSKAYMTMHMNNLTNPGEPPMFAETWPENQRHVTGFYLKSNNRINSAASISLDARIDYSTSELLSEQGINQFSTLRYNAGKSFRKLIGAANMNIVYKKKKLDMKAGIGFGERLPSQTEQFGFYLYNAMDGYDYIGNPDIKVEKALHIWSSMQYSLPNIKIAWEGYFNHVFDYILGVTKPGYHALNLYASGVKQYENLTYARIFSTNFRFSWKPVHSVELFDLAKFNYGVTNTGQPLPMIEPLKNQLSVKWQVKRLFVQVENEYTAAQNRIDKNFGEIPSAPYMLFHIRSGYRFTALTSTVKLNLGVENIFNKAYSDHLDWGSYLRPGRNIYLQLIVKR